MSGSTAIGGDIINAPPYDPAAPRASGLPSWLIAVAIGAAVLVALVASRK